MRFMGIDPGAKRVGLALGDDESRMAFPHKTLLRKDDASLLRALVDEAQANDVQRFVLGLPLRMNGMEGPEAKRARVFASKLESAACLPVALWDERLTSVAAERQLRALSVRGDKKKAVVDQAAATLLLQSYLDAQHDP